MQKSPIEIRLDKFEEQANKQRSCILAIRWNLLRTVQFAQEIVRDANPQDPKIQELEDLYQALFALKP